MPAPSIFTGATTGDFRPLLFGIAYRWATLDWLAETLAARAGVSADAARATLVDCIPFGEERCMSEGGDFFWVFGEAAGRLGLDPCTIELRPAVVQ